MTHQPRICCDHVSCNSLVDGLRAEITQLRVEKLQAEQSAAGWREMLSQEMADMTRDLAQ